mmetsp:Transcript_12803/g.24996  ORF Transcript_12803/g.24996 Transcript_12803/m.24996 type:complete len:85 (-) Transcript_12803:2276-2530(-)
MQSETDEMTDCRHLTGKRDGERGLANTAMPCESRKTATRFDALGLSDARSVGRNRRKRGGEMLGRDRRHRLQAEATRGVIPSGK